MSLFRMRASGALMVGVIGLLPAAAGAQDEPEPETDAWSAPLTPRAPEFREVHTGDGSRFILIPTGGPPVVHWVVATPAGVLEDTAGLEGLSFAVARASLAGTRIDSSRNPEAELAALAEEDRLERQLDRARATGEPDDEILTAAVVAARERVAELSDPLAWERALREAPAIDARSSQVTEGTLLHITTSGTALPRVAQLLYERREGTVLRGVHRAFRAVRRDLVRRRSNEPRDRMRREVLGLSFLGHAYAGAYTVPDSPRPLSRDRALQVFQQTQHPSRAIHVLAGGFDADGVVEMLEGVFGATSLPPYDLPPPPPPPFEHVERQATILGNGPRAVAIGFRLPRDHDAQTLAVLVEWLTGDFSRLRSALELRGHTEIAINGTAPFPGRTHGLFLLEVEDLSTGTDAQPAAQLRADLESILDNIVERGPTAPEVRRAVARVLGRSAASRLGTQSLALELALACGLEGRDPAPVLRPRPEVNTEQLHELSRALLIDTNRVIVTLEARS